MSDDLLCPYYNNAAACSYPNNHTECCNHSCRCELVARIREDEASKNAEAVIIAAVESHRAGYADRLVAGVEHRDEALNAEGFQVGWDQGYAEAMGADWGDAKRSAWDYTRGLADARAAVAGLNLQTYTHAPYVATFKRDALAAIDAIGINP